MSLAVGALKTSVACQQRTDTRIRWPSRMWREVTPMTRKRPVGRRVWWVVVPAALTALAALAQLTETVVNLSR
jgi:hypothetical protein